MKHHQLKTLPQYFWATACHKKRFEVRKNDRKFNVGDYLELNEWNETRGYTGWFIRVEVDFVLDGGIFGIDEEYCIMSLCDRFLLSQKEIEK